MKKESDGDVGIDACQSDDRVVNELKQFLQLHAALTSRVADSIDEFEDREHKRHLCSSVGYEIEWYYFEREYKSK